MLKKIILLLLGGVVFILQAYPAHASYDITELIDTPTARSVDLGNYILSFRMYRGGSLVARLQYGIIMENLALGVSLNAENVVGSNTVSLRRPYLYGKLPLYSGNQIWPALSFGFDEQGYGKYSDEGTYQYPPVGFFMVASKYGVLPGMNINAGVNSNHGLPAAEEQSLTGFAGFSYLVGPEFMVLAELRDVDDSGAVVNAGIKYLLSPELSFELNFIELGGGRDSNRILKVFYKGDF